MSALMGDGVLALWLDVAPELALETDDWYVDEHLPERIDIGGYLRARRYRALEGGPGYLTLFEAADPDALASAGYLGLVGNISERSQRIRAGFSNVARNTFRVQATAGRGLGAVMISLRLRETGPQQAGNGAIDRHVRQLLRHRDAVGAHWLRAAPEVRARMDAVRAVGQRDASTGDVLMLEATHPGTLHALRDGALSDAALSRLGWRVENAGIYGLMYEVSGRISGREVLLGDRL